MCGRHVAGRRFGWFTVENATMATTVKKSVKKSVKVPVVTEAAVSMEARLAAMEARLAESEKREREAEKRGYETGLKAKRAARAERAARRETAGLHPVPLRENDATYNVLARCEFVVPGVAVIECAAVMIDAEGTARFGLAPNPIFGVPGVTGEGEEEVIAALSATLDAAPEVLAHLRETFDAAAEGHDYLAPADRKRAEKIARENAGK